MKPNAQEAVDYFTQHKGFFWHWADNGQVIEWDNGETLCYKAEIVDLLRQLKGQHIVPFSSIILFIAACSDNYKTSRGKEVLETFLDTTIRNGKREVEVLLQQSLTFMDVLSGLPKDVKNSVVKKAHILSEVFQLQQNLSIITWLFLADELDSGRIDLSKEITRPQLLGDYFKEALGALSAAGLMYPTTEKLVMKVLTGLPEIPESIEVIVPETESKELLIQLTNEPTTAGIANLTTHLIAALNIPKHSQGSGEQPLGGISDITNKGSYDRLLLSELAQDEELLTARLVNNEALYFRREEPPEDVNRKRVILLDTTIKMWGKPRFFGISAALACTLNTKHGETIEAYVLGGDYHQRVDLFSKNGVVESLKELNPALHCGKALNTFVSEQSKTNNDEFILITGDWQHQSYDFQALFAVAKTSLNFIISVSRDGELRLFECINGNAKLINTTKFDLDSLLAKKVQTVKKEKLSKKFLDTEIAFLNREAHPLYFPAPSSLRLTTDKSFFKNKFNYDGHKEGFVVAVADDLRLLYWTQRSRGAIELLDEIEGGDYFFGWQEEDRVVYILVIQQGENKITLYTLNRETLDIGKTIFSKVQVVHEKVVFNGRSFNIISGTQKVELDCIKETLLPPVPVGNEIVERGINDVRKLEPYARKMVNNGYNTLNRFENILISERSYYGKRLCFDDNEIDTSRGIIFRTPNWYQTTPSILATATGSREFFHVTDNPYVKFKKFVWGDGSQIIIDSRGLAHLISTDITIPQITIALIENKEIACWASDGASCGSKYFIQDANNIISEEKFYEKYLKAYINRILQ
jgi:hypothetical protein